MLLILLFIFVSPRVSQLSSVAQSCPTLCDPTNRSTPGLSVHHQLLESTQTHVHRVSDAIQPSYPLSPLLLLPSIFPSVRVFSNEHFMSGGQSIGASASASVLPMDLGVQISSCFAPGPDGAGGRGLCGIQQASDLCLTLPAPPPLLPSDWHSPHPSPGLQ